jgi:hypothetical protein
MAGRIWPGYWRRKRILLRRNNRAEKIAGRVLRKINRLNNADIIQPFIIIVEKATIKKI